jgi:hypothetical protein
LEGSATPDPKRRGILRAPSMGRSDTSSKSAGIYLDSGLSTCSGTSAESLKSSQKLASEKGSEIQAQIKELQKLNSTLGPQIDHYKKIVERSTSFSHKHDALQEIKTRREQFVARER